MTKTASRLIWIKQRDVVNTVPENDCEEHVTKLMNRRAKPRGKQNAGPPKRSAIVRLRPLLQFIQDKAKHEKNTKYTSKLNGSNFEDIDDEVGEHGDIISPFVPANQQPETFIKFIREVFNGKAVFTDKVF